MNWEASQRCRDVHAAPVGLLKKHRLCDSLYGYSAPGRGVRRDVGTQEARADGIVRGRFFGAVDTEGSRLGPGGSRTGSELAAEEVAADCYSEDRGRPGIDPEVAVRLMLAGLLPGYVHDRRLMREARVNLAIRWFIGYGLNEELPHHSSLTRIRQRWGEARFREIFRRTV